MNSNVTRSAQDAFAYTTDLQIIDNWVHEFESIKF